MVVELWAKSSFTTTTFVVIISVPIAIFIMNRLRASLSETLFPGKKTNGDHGHIDLTTSLPNPTRVSQTLASALPDSVIFPKDTATFKKLVNSHWALQEARVVPACVVRPRDAQELAMAITVLKREFDQQQKQGDKSSGNGLFAVRSGGHSPVPAAASIQGGVVIDMGLICEVTPSEDDSTVVIGVGAKWMHVSKILDGKGLAVSGGRNSPVGVGGLILGGGLSYFTPQFGMVCSNVISFEIVLANGTITTASASSNPDLWRALKGGSNNFGIVTRVTTRSFPSSKIWGGYLYMPGFQAAKTLKAFHESLNRISSGEANAIYSAGPIVCFTYIHAIGIQTVAVNLVYTKAAEQAKKWPEFWKTSPFGSLWRIWSTCKIRTLTDATDEVNTLNPPGRRQLFATTTIKNDPVTLTAVHSAYRDAVAKVRIVSVKELVWTLVVQPFVPKWAFEGDANPLGLEDSSEALVLVSFTINWAESKDDEFVTTAARHAIEQMDAAAAANNTGHRYRYLNYAAKWQKPFEGYGEDNLRFLRETSKKYDPDGLFQKGCVGGFKLG